MACNIIYSCMKPWMGSLVYHNLLINDIKWHYPGNENPVLSEDEVIKMVSDTNCNEDELIIFGFVKGWKVECQY